MSGYGVLSLPKDDFREPPGADPHAACCGEGRLITVPYPIKFLIFRLLDRFLAGQFIPPPGSTLKPRSAVAAQVTDEVDDINQKRHCVHCY